MFLAVYEREVEQRWSRIEREARERIAAASRRPDAESARDWFERLQRRARVDARAARVPPARRPRPRAQRRATPRPTAASSTAWPALLERDRRRPRGRRDAALDDHRARATASSSSTSPLPDEATEERYVAAATRACIEPHHGGNRWRRRPTANGLGHGRRGAAAPVRPARARRRGRATSWRPTSASGSREVVAHAARALAGLPRAARPPSTARSTSATCRSCSKGELDGALGRLGHRPALRRAEVEPHLAALARRRAARRRVPRHGHRRQHRPRGMFVLRRARSGRELCALTACARCERFGITPRLPRRRMAPWLAPSPAHMTWRDQRVDRHRPAPAAAPGGDDAARRSSSRSSTPSTPTCSTLTRPSPRCSPTSSSRDGCGSRRRDRRDLQRALHAARCASASARRGASSRTRSTARPTACGARRASTTACTSGRTDDRRGRGRRGMLITNLFMKTQPVIRYEVTDMVRLDDDPCPCGRPTRTVSAIEGRSATTSSSCPPTAAAPCACTRSTCARRSPADGDGAPGPGACCADGRAARARSSRAADAGRAGDRCAPRLDRRAAQAAGAAAARRCTSSTVDALERDARRHRQAQARPLRGRAAARSRLT